MTTAYDIPADILINRLSRYIKESIDEVDSPTWAGYVKTGSHTERAPHSSDWWYVRSASMLRKLYMKGPIGVSRMRKEYGGRKRRGSKPAHFQKAGGKIIRTIFQQLEDAELAEKAGIKGRMISSKGKSMLDALASQIKDELDRERPDLKKY
jgi:small subunit ribosomal protein S19e